MAGRAWWSQTFANDGGPLIILPLEWLGDWGRSAADYERACGAVAPIDILPVGEGFGVVFLGLEMVYTANWLRLPGQAGVIAVGWQGGEEDSESKLVKKLSDPGLPWKRRKKRMTIESGVLFLMHAAGWGPEVALSPVGDLACIGKTVPVGIGPGKFALETLFLDEVEGDDGYSCVLCRWLPI